ncbi:MAG TPA: hypothetical protein VFV99_22235 [Kofleriaceae bacterium]|nr:hypothetical protein [Kofleriaceae bacterium]
MSLFVVIAVTATVIGLVGGIPDPRKVKRELARARVQTIDSLVEGKPGAVRGTVAVIDPETTIWAPLTQHRCVYVLVVFDEVGVGGDYRELGRIEGTASFLLRSEHGTARIVPSGARLALPGHSVARPFMNLGPMLTELSRGQIEQPNYPTSWLRATEYRIDEGEELTIRGWVTREPLPEASDAVSGYREQLPTRAVISGSRRAKLLIG